MIKIDPVFISIDDDIFNVGEIQVLSYEDKKNELGKDSGVYILHIYMKNEIGSMNKMFSNKQMRDKVFRKAADQLLEFSSEKRAADRTLSRNKDRNLLLEYDLVRQQLLKRRNGNADQKPRQNNIN